MNLGRIFATALARRVAFVVVAAILASFGFSGRANAQTFPNCNNTDMGGFFACPNREQAYATAKGAAQNPVNSGHIVNITNQRYHGIQVIGSTGQVCYEIYGTNAYGYPRNVNACRSWNTECPVGYTWNDVTYTCGVPCQGLDPLTGVHAPGDSPTVCNGGCAYECSGITVLLTIDGQPRSVCGGPNWAPTGAVCTASNPDSIPEVTDTDGDGSSDENDDAPNNPGESNGSDQDGSSACGGDGQPECDGTNSGSGNGNTSGGGGNCQTPPSSTGDAILAQIAFQTWATRCAIEGNANEGEGGVAVGSGQPDWTKGNGPPVPTDDTDYVTEQSSFGIGVNAGMLDQENIFGAGSCPTITGTIYGRTFSTSSIPAWCQIIVWMRAVILIVGAFTALNILLGRTTQ